MTAQQNVTTGKFKVKVSGDKGFVSEIVRCDMHSPRSLVLQSWGDEGLELKIHIAEEHAIEQGVDYKVDGSNQNSAYYKNQHGQFKVKSGSVKLTTFDLKEKTVLFSFNFTASDNNDVLKILSGDGAFQGINQLS
ncbi:hypothetical protein [Pseudomonas sp. NPDC089741]|uniref:hypothetical protein n=1 Tax=Pseudomonas sp. NPDC089741 TaxID=3364470 RepID=UPI00380A2087